MPPFATADLCDAHGDAVRVAEPVLRLFGARRTFAGPIRTLKVFEDNVLVREQLEEPGDGRVLVVDGGGSLRRALLGDRLAALAAENGWAGVVLNGCIRDADEVAGLDVGVLALATCPRRSDKMGRGTLDLPVTFAGLTFHTGDYLYVDGDGCVLAGRDLLAPPSDEPSTD